MSLVFYFTPMSTAVATHWVLEELGEPYEKVHVDLAAGDQRKPEFLALNPNGKVPVVVHDGTPIFESAAIAIHLGETFGVEKGLFPAPGPERARALEWLVWTHATLNEALSRYSHATSARIPAERHNAKAGEVAKAEVEKLLGVLDASLEGKRFVLGDSFSIVDAHMAAFVGYVGMCGFEIGRNPRLDAWLRACSSRPAFATVMKP